MILTLYKNCILNDNYNEVFDLTKKTRVIDGITESYSVFTDYLKGLDKNIINLPNVYYSRNMSFTLGISGDNKAKEAFEYNYCKIEAEGIIRYCFITDIELANSVATYYTEEDIWSNYAYDMQFRYGYLTNALRTSYKKVDNDGNITYKDINYYTLPTGYQSNNLPKYGRERTMDALYNIVLQLQTYNLETGGATSKRVVRTVLLSFLTETGIDPETKEAIWNVSYNFSEKEVLDYLTNLQIASSAKTIALGKNIISYYTDKETYDANFQIDNITILPKDWNITEKMATITQDKLKEAIVGLYVTQISETELVQGITFINFPQVFYGNDYSHITPKELISGELENDFKIISFGTRTGQYEINMNGTSIPYSVDLSSDDTNFKILLNLQNKCIDITNDFVLEIPFDVVTADTTAQRKIAKNTAIYNGVANIIGGTAETALNVTALATGNVTSSSSSVLKRSYKTPTYGEKYAGKRYLSSRKVTSETTKSPLGTGSASGILGGVRDIADGIVGIANANTPQYTTNTGTFVTSEALLNAVYGLCYLYIEPDNSEFVQNMLNLIGYNVFEVIYDNIIFNQDFIFDNVLKFETVDIYGSFPLSIKEALETILTNGFRIYYNTNADIQ